MRQMVTGRGTADGSRNPGKDTKGNREAGVDARGSSFPSGPQGIHFQSPILPQSGGPPFTFPTGQDAAHDRKQPVESLVRGSDVGLLTPRPAFTARNRREHPTASGSLRSCILSRVLVSFPQSLTCQLLRRGVSVCYQKRK